MRRAVEDRAEVVVERRRHAAGTVALTVRMHLVGAVERGRVVGDRRQHLDIELDQLQGILGQGTTLGDHHRVRVAHVADLVVGEHLERPVGPPPRVGVAPIGPARRSLRSAAVSTATTPGAALAASVEIDTMRPRAMSLRAKRDVQHARNHDVIDVACPGR